MQFPVAKPLIALVGPTAVGKSKLAIEVAEKLSGEIISADSRLFYRGMNIGTAKPSKEERLIVSHHLIDVADLDEIWSLGLFQKEVRKCIQEIHLRGHLPFLVGGTGQYIRSVIEGWSIPQLRPNEFLRKILIDWSKEVGVDGLHKRLAIIDPEAAGSIDPLNLRRTIRALEVILTSGIKFSAQRTKQGSPYNIKIIGLFLPRPELYKRVDDRIDSMINNGLVDEVKDLLSRGYPPDLPSLSAIGYREVTDFIFNKITLEEAIVLMKRRTRKFVRRQANWFKPSDPNIHWFENNENAIDQISSFIQSNQDWMKIE